MLPETWEFSRCLGAQNFMGERGQMWERVDISGCPKSHECVGKCGRNLCAATCVQIWVQMDDQICVNLWVRTYLSGHVFVSN